MNRSVEHQDRSGMAARIVAKESELARVREALAVEGTRQVGGSSRRKSFGVRVGAQVKRMAKLSGDVQRIERELQALRSHDTPGRRPAGQYDALTLAGARHVRTDLGWHEVVKVNRVTVKVKVRPGMDDLIKIRTIIQARGADGTVLPARRPDASL